MLVHQKRPGWLPLSLNDQIPGGIAVKDKGMTSSNDLEIAEFRKALGAFVTGVTVVTTMSRDGTPRGVTANSFTSVSLQPPLILVCLAHSAASHQAFTEAEVFAVNILSEEQRLISSKFASSRADKFADLEWHSAVTGSPIIKFSSAWMDCVKHDMVDAGDHTILIGRVKDFGHGPSMPLGYYRGQYVSLSVPQHDNFSPRP
jgi:flavin reductase (DIM6/NTAB) family NADH-FMN oxidoreductase RutF